MSFVSKPGRDVFVRLRSRLDVRSVLLGRITAYSAWILRLPDAEHGQR